MPLNNDTIRVAGARAERVVRTLVREAPDGRRTLMALLKNELGVFGTLTETAPYVSWGHPGDRRACFRSMKTFTEKGFKFWDDDGHVLRPFDPDAV